VWLLRAGGHSNAATCSNVRGWAAGPLRHAAEVRGRSLLQQQGELHGRALLQQPIGTPAVTPHVATDPTCASPPCHFGTNSRRGAARMVVGHRGHIGAGFSRQHAAGSHTEPSRFSTLMGMRHATRNVQRSHCSRPRPTAGYMRRADGASCPDATLRWQHAAHSEIHACLSISCASLSSSHPCSKHERYALSRDDRGHSHCGHSCAAVRDRGFPSRLSRPQPPSIAPSVRGHVAVLTSRILRGIRTAAEIPHL
jgi:hypothetical protein